MRKLIDNIIRLYYDIQLSLSIRKHNKKIDEYNKLIDNVKQKYIILLKENNKWNYELEAKFRPKVKKRKGYKMDYFDEVFAIKEAKRKSLLKTTIFNKYKKYVYGQTKVKDYIYWTTFLKVVLEICKVNGWTTRSEWIKHGVPMNKYVKQFLKASIAFADIKRYYEGLYFEKRRKLYSGS